MDPRVLLIVAVGAGLWFVGHKTVEGVKKVDNAIAHKFHHGKKSDQPPSVDGK